MRRRPWHRGRFWDWTRFPRTLCPDGMALCGTRKFSSFPQMSDTLPTILTSPFRNKLKDAVDRITLLGRPLLDPGNQQSIDRSQLLARLMTLSFRSTGHCATSLQADPNRDLVPRATMRNAHRSRAVLTIDPERSWLRLSTRCHVRGAALLSVGRRSADTRHGRDEVGSALCALDVRCSATPLGRCFAKRRWTVAVSAPYLLKEHPGGKSIKRKLSPKGGEPPQGYGGNLQRSRATSPGACAVCPGRQLAKL